MCGITGIFHRSTGTAVRRETLERMTDTIAHRGPDGLNGQAVARFLHEHLSGTAYHSHRLWTLLCLKLWYRIFILRLPSGGAATGASS